MNELALFAGAGGGILGGKLLGWRTVCAVEWEQYPACVLAARQNDGLLPPFPIWDDVQTFDGTAWTGIVDVISGGFPCQDISAAGKGGGIESERSGMWKQMARIIGEVRPPYAFVENSPMLTTRGLGTVLSDLAEMGFNAEWGVLSAAEVGARHKRDRMWIVAQNTNSRRKHGKSWNTGELAASKAEWPSSTIPNKSIFAGLDKNNWKTEPDVVRMVNGVADTVDRLKAIGNGQVPLCAATAWNILKGRLDERV